MQFNVRLHTVDILHKHANFKHLHMCAYCHEYAV